MCPGLEADGCCGCDCWGLSGDSDGSDGAAEVPAAAEVGEQLMVAADGVLAAAGAAAVLMVAAAGVVAVGGSGAGGR